jgi:hypothetical protein
VLNKSYVGLRVEEVSNDVFFVTFKEGIDLLFLLLLALMFLFEYFDIFFDFVSSFIGLGFGLGLGVFL